jgi:hypothetical protein
MLSLPHSLVLSLALPLAAQATLFVGPGGFTTIQQAVNVANPGDTILVSPGVYSGFTLTEGVSIRASTPATVLVNSWTVVQPAFGQVANFVGIQFAYTSVGGGGVSTFDGCVWGQSNGQLYVAATTVVLQRCTLTQPTPSFIAGATLRAQSATLSVVDSFIQGSPVGLLGPPGLPIDLQDVRFFGSGLTVRAVPTAVAWPALRGDSACRIWISDSTLDTGANGCAIDSLSGPLLGRVDRCVLTPNCSLLPQGFVIGAAATVPTLGAAFTATFRTQPFGLLAVVHGTVPADSTWAALEQPLLLQVASAAPLATLVADAQGVASSSWLLPSSPAFVGYPLWLQGIGFGGAAFQLQASPLVGGLVR